MDLENANSSAPPGGREEAHEIDYWQSIPKLMEFLRRYVLADSENDAQDISDFLASNYRNFLMHFVYKDVQIVNNPNVLTFVLTCLYIVKKNLKKCTHHNIYFVCLNTALAFLRFDFSGRLCAELIMLDMFYDLMKDVDEWEKDDLIPLFGKLFFIRRFIAHILQKKWVSKTKGRNLYEAIGKFFSDNFIQEYIDERISGSTQTSNGKSKNACDEQYTGAIIDQLKEFTFLEVDPDACPGSEGNTSKRKNVRIISITGTKGKEKGNEEEEEEEAEENDEEEEEEEENEEDEEEEEEYMHRRQYKEIKVVHNIELKENENIRSNAEHSEHSENIENAKGENVGSGASENITRINEEEENTSNFQDFNDMDSFGEHEKFMHKIQTLEENCRRKYFLLDIDRTEFIKQLDDSVYYDLYKIILNFIVKNDLSQYILQECIQIIFELCKTKGGINFFCDYIAVYKFHARYDLCRSERLLFFINRIIQEAEPQQKLKFLPLLTSISFCFFLLNSENSELRINSEMTLLKWGEINITKAYVENSGVPQSWSNKELGAFAMSPLFMQKKYVHLTNIILFHMDYIIELLEAKQNKTSTDDIYAKSKKREKQYESFFEISEADAFGKCYIKTVLRNKKEKLFLHSIYKREKKSIIRNNIIEVENKLSIIIGFFRFFKETFYHINFIMFTLYMCRTIQKICYKLCSEYSKDFFFVIKKLFIQIQLVLKDLEEIEKHKNKSRKRKRVWKDEAAKYFIDYDKENLSYGEDKQNINIHDTSCLEQVDTYVKGCCGEKEKIEIYIDLYHRTYIKKIAKEMKNIQKTKNCMFFFVLLKKLYDSIIDFVFPVKQSALFFNGPNAVFYKDVLLSIVHFYCNIWTCRTDYLEKFFFLHIFSRIKKKMDPAWVIADKTGGAAFNICPWKNTEVDKDMDSSEVHDDQKKKPHKLRLNYISVRMHDHWCFLLDYLKTLLLSGIKNIGFMKKENFKKIYNFCMIPLMNFFFYVSSKSSANCFMLSIEVLFYLYRENCKSGRNRKLTNSITYLLFSCTLKALRSMKRKDKVFQHKKEKKYIISKDEEMRSLAQKKKEKGQNEQSEKSEQFSHNEQMKKANKKRKFHKIDMTNKVKEANSNKKIIIPVIKMPDEFVKPFRAYYFNTSLDVFIGCLKALTNIVKMEILKEESINCSSLRIQKSKIKKRKKWMKREKQKVLIVKSFTSYKLYTHFVKMCHTILKCTNNDTFYHYRKHVLQFIQNMITWSIVFILKYKCKNLLHLEKILSFCYYVLYADCNIEVLKILHYMMCSLKCFATLCPTKLKNPNSVIEQCGDVINEVLTQYNSFCDEDTDVWEQAIVGNNSFSLFADRVPECPGD